MIGDTDAIMASRDEPLRFAVVFDRHFDAVHRYLARRVGADAADDLASETFTTAFRLRMRYDVAYPDARPWLLGIATNLIVFDPQTAVLLGEEDVLLDKVDYLDADPPVVIGYNTYLVSDVVAAIP